MGRTGKVNVQDEDVKGSMSKEKIINFVRLILLTVLLGAFAGSVIWGLLKATGLFSVLLWEKLPAFSGLKITSVFICAAGGLLTGLLHKKSGDYPEELQVVMGKIKTDKRYEYGSMPQMLVCALIPLAIGASVGPEAGLTGIIAGLCYWVGDNVTYAKQNIEVFSELGEAVTLGQLFHSPLFGILAVEEDEDSIVPPMSKGSKLFLYGLSTAASFFVVSILNKTFGAAMSGFPSFAEALAGITDYLMLLVYIPVGIVIYILFELSERLTSKIAGRVPVVLRETICGVVIGIMVIATPLVMYSGEEQMGELMGTFTAYSPYVLIGICLLKLFMTGFCINFGMKGGHFFPLIYACTCMGFALVSIVFSDPMPHAAFAAAAVTASVLGAQLKKPVAVSLLLLLCFPVKILLLIFVCAAAGAQFGRVFKPGRA
ncbi:MAG: chloride channel protein [Lachnospiraceae bacterium]|nr:chloride channel protein [Lachnospiraceae bacterium]